jgi:hypothetical protein
MIETLSTLGIGLLFGLAAGLPALCMLLLPDIARHVRKWRVVRRARRDLWGALGEPVEGIGQAMPPADKPHPDTHNRWAWLEITL